MLAEAQRSAHDNAFILRLPEIAAAQVIVLLRQGEIAAAARLAGQHDLPLSRARVLIAQGDPAAALAGLETVGRQMEALGWADERLRALVLQAVAQQALEHEGGTEVGAAEEGAAVRALGDALALAEPGGFIRLFVDEGPPMADLLSAAAAQGVRSDYVGGSWPPSSGRRRADDRHHPFRRPPPRVPRRRPDRSARASSTSCGWSPRACRTRRSAQRLFLALDTVKGHNRRIFEKLGVQRRTEAVARATELGLL